MSRHAPPLERQCRFALTEDAPLAWEAFSRFITTLTALRGADLLQMKGLLNIAGCRGPVVVQFMQHLAQRPVELQAWPDERSRKPTGVRDARYRRGATDRCALLRCRRAATLA